MENVMPSTDPYAKQVSEWAKKRRLILRQFQQGATARQLADTHDVSIARIYFILKKEGATFRSYGAKK
jgi:hypothetical protein